MITTEVSNIQVIQIIFFPIVDGESSSIYFNNNSSWDFPGDAVIKNPPANAGDPGSSPGLGRSHMPRSN